MCYIIILNIFRKGSVRFQWVQIDLEKIGNPGIVGPVDH